MNCPHAAVAALFGGVCPWCVSAPVESMQVRGQVVLASEPDWVPRPTLVRAEVVEVEQEPRPEDYVRLLEQFDNVACRRSLAEFARLAWLVLRSAVALEWGDHIDTICHHVQQQLEDRWRALRDPTFRMRAQDIVINCPPRSLKSFILIVACAWAWLHEPTLQVVYLSTNPRLTIQSGRMFRKLITSSWFTQTFAPPWTVASDEDALGDIGNTAGGFRKAKGLDGAITGEGCDWLQTDDPHDLRDTKERIRTVIDGYDDAVANRINDPRCSIRTLIMQRVGVVDMSMRWLESKWILHLRLPMEMEASTECPCGTCSPAVNNAYGWRDVRAPGEVLHPRFTPEYLAAELKRLREHGYATQMQQRPGARGGERFKTKDWSWHVVERADGTVPPSCAVARKLAIKGANGTEALVIKRRAGKPGQLDLDWLCVSIDPTQGSTEDDASALGIGIIAGKANRVHVLEDRTDGPASWNQALARVRAAVARAAALAGYQRRFTVLIEKKAMGGAEDAPLPTQVREMLAKGEIQYPDGRTVVAKLVLYEPTGKGDKEQRAEAMEPDQEAGLISVAEGEPWVAGFVGEHEVFPRGKDDRVDYMSQCVDHHRVAGGGSTLKITDIGGLRMVR